MAQATLRRRTISSGGWPHRISEQQWNIYARVIDEAQARGIPFALGGAFALAAHTGWLRNTKDLDIYVLPENRDRMVEAVTSLGLTDYYSKLPYDRWWIYRSTTGDTIVDIIWAMANHRAMIDDLWMSGPEIDLRTRKVQVLPAEAMLWDKLYILQRDRCDWPDIMNLLFYAGADVDWEYLLRRIGDDVPLLAGALSVFRWVSPGKARALPDWLWERLGIAAPPRRGGSINKRRVGLLDRRPWFGPDRETLQAA